jgi:O-antigen/teichoic acid export membrane protein
MVMQSADVIAIERLTGDMSQVAVYGLAALFGKSVLFLPGSVGRVFFREIAEADTRADLLKGIRALMLVTGSISVIIAAGVYIIFPLFIKILYGEKYIGSIPVLRIMCFGIVFNGLCGALSVINIAIKKPKASALISLTGVIICVPAMLLLVPAMGAAGAAWGMNGAYILCSAVGLWLLARNIRLTPYCRT